MESEFSRKIKELRLKREMTLEQVANIVGVGKSTVRKWETGMIANMKRDKISLLAKALDVSPAYLMDWEIEENKTTDILTDGERKLLSLFREVPVEMQDVVLDMIQIALKNRK